MFYFSDPDKLLKALDNFINNQESEDYQIIEIKNQLHTPLEVVKLHVYNNIGGTVGEI